MYMNLNINIYTTAPANECPGYDSKPSDAKAFSPEASGDLEYSFIALLPSPH